MYDALSNLNWLAVALATLAYYLLGALWFTPLFGRTWDHSIGVERSRTRAFGAAYYVIPLVSALLTSLAVAILITALGPGSIWEAIGVGAAIGITAAAISVNNGLTPHTPHPFVFGAVTGGYHLVGILIVSAIVGAFAA